MTTAAVTHRPCPPGTLPTVARLIRQTRRHAVAGPATTMGHREPRERREARRP